MKNRLLEKYKKEIIPALKEKFGYGNKMAVPRLEKVVLNIGLSAGFKDEKYIESVKQTLERISGQKPVFTKAKKSIASFKIRQGNVVGVMVTIRGGRMYDFVDKLINITLPRVRDFRGISPKSVDKNGNLSLGFKEHIVFPEISADEVERLHGLEVAVVTTAEKKEEGFELLKLLGFPFKENKK